MTISIDKQEKNAVEITAATKSFIAKGSGLEITFVIHIGDDENEINRISPSLTRLAFNKTPVKLRIIPCEDEIFEKRLGAGKSAGNRRRNVNNE